MPHSATFSLPLYSLRSGVCLSASGLALTPMEPGTSSGNISKAWNPKSLRYTGLPLVAISLTQHFRNLPSRLNWRNVLNALNQRNVPIRPNPRSFQCLSSFKNILTQFLGSNEEVADTCLKTKLAFHAPIVLSGCMCCLYTTLTASFSITNFQYSQEPPPNRLNVLLHQSISHVINQHQCHIGWSHMSSTNINVSTTDDVY